MFSLSQVNAFLEADGISGAAWARQHGFPPALVYRVLRGEAKCRRGQTHQIAVALGIKAPISAEQQALWHAQQEHLSPSSVAPPGNPVDITYSGSKNGESREEDQTTTDK